MVEMFFEGGWGMWPTLLFGLGLLACSVRYAARPRSEQVPLLVSLGLLTLCAGALGFITGVITTLRYIAGVAPEQRWLAMVGVGESANDLFLALFFATAAMVAVVVGAWRLASRAGSLGLAAKA